MNKRSIFLIVLIFFSLQNYFSAVNAQNIAFKKQFISDLRCPAYYSAGELAIHYYKCFGDMILKYHDAQLQLLDADAEIVWENSLEQLKCYHDHLNQFKVVSDENYLYIIQCGEAMSPSKIPVNLIKVNLEGEIVVKNLTGVYPIRSLEGFDLFDNNLYLSYSMFISAEEWRYYVAELNRDLEPIGDPVMLNYHGPDQKNSIFSLNWYYLGLTEEGLSYRCYFYNNDGRYSGIANPKEQQWSMQASVRPGLSVVYSDPDSVKTVEPVKALYDNHIAFDNTKYKVYVSDDRTGGNTLTEYCDPFQFSLFKEFGEVFVEKENVRSGNLVEEFYSLTQGENISNAKVYLFDFLDDPINNSLTGIFICVARRTYYTFTLSEDLKINYVVPFKLEDNYPSRFPDNNVGYHLKKGKSQDVIYPEGHKPNAMDFIANLNENCFFTILNYDNYQLVFTDNEETNVCKVYKIIK